MMGGGMGVHTQQQRRPQNLALPGTPGFPGGGGGGGGVLMGREGGGAGGAGGAGAGGGFGKPPLYPGASMGGVGATGAGFNGGLPTPESLLPSFVGSSSPGFSVSPLRSLGHRSDPRQGKMSNARHLSFYLFFLKKTLEGRKCGSPNQIRFGAAVFLFIYFFLLGQCVVTKNKKRSLPKLKVRIFRTRLVAATL